MSDQIEGFEPIHSAHAIEQVAFVIQFDGAITDEALQRVKSATAQFGGDDDLPGYIEIQGVSFVIGTNAPQQTYGSSSGFIRRSVARDGSLECELRIERNSITFLTTKYSRWSEVWQRVSRYLDTLLPIYFEQLNLLAVGLNYVDKFSWNGELNNFNARSLLKEDSKYISSHIFDTAEFWHSHTGVFIRSDEQTKRLLNVNIDHLDEARSDGMKRVVSITTTVTDQFNQPGYQPFPINDKTITMVGTHMQNIHDFGKEILGELLAKDMSDRIALGE